MKYPIHLTRDDYHELTDDWDTTITWRVIYEDQPGADAEGRKMSSVHADLISLNVTPDGVNLDVEVPAPLMFGLPGLGNDDRVYRVMEAMASDDETVQIDGEDVDTVLGWDDD